MIDLIGSTIVKLINNSNHLSLTESMFVFFSSTVFVLLIVFAVFTIAGDKK